MQTARDEGCDVFQICSCIPDKGCFYPPTLITNVDVSHSPPSRGRDSVCVFCSLHARTHTHTHTHTHAHAHTHTHDLLRHRCATAAAAALQTSSTVVQEEIFGPVVTAQAFRTSKEAIALANNTKCDKQPFSHSCTRTRAHLFTSCNDLPCSHCLCLRCSLVVPPRSPNSYGLAGSVWSENLSKALEVGLTQIGENKMV